MHHRRFDGASHYDDDYQVDNGQLTEGSPAQQLKGGDEGNVDDKGIDGHNRQISDIILVE